MLKIETLSAADFNIWVTHCAEIFRPDEDYFRRHFENDPQKDLNSIFVFKDGDKIASTVRVFTREIYFAGKKLKMGGIGEVCTKPEYQGQRLSLQLLEAAMDYMEAEKFDISLLFASRYSHYERHGYQRVNFSRQIIQRPEKVEADVRNLTEKDFPAMAELYKKYSSGLDGTVVRSLDYWKNWSSNELKNPQGLFENNQLLAYICSNENKVTELIGNEKEVRVLLSHLTEEELNVPSFARNLGQFIKEENDPLIMIKTFNPNLPVFDEVVFWDADKF